MLLMGDMGHSMDAMMSEMDATAQVAAICAALDVDVAFIDLTIPHHESAIMSSQVVVEQAVHPEIRDFAQRVIEDQDSVKLRSCSRFVWNSPDRPSVAASKR